MPTMPYQAYDVLLSPYHGDKLSSYVVTMVKWLLASGNCKYCWGVWGVWLMAMSSSLAHCLLN
jgi:hypothetical protein